MGGSISRRAVLGGAVLGVGGFAAKSTLSASGADLLRPFLFTSPRLAPFRTPLPRPPVLSGPHFELAARTSTHRFHPNLDPSPAFGYGGQSYLGPTLEAQAEESQTLHFENRLGRHPFAEDIDTTLHGASAADQDHPRSVLHLHGGVTPPASDGHTEATIRPGMQYQHTYPNGQEAATLWYHDHAMGITRLNVYAGLAGMYLQRDPWDTGRSTNPLGLPAGRYEMPLVLQEKIFRSDGHQSVRSTPLVPRGSWEGGAVGDVGLVNGAVWPELDVDRGLYRFRVLNAGSFSVWNLFFDNQMAFWVIGTDGGLLDTPVQTRNVRISSGERLDLLVDFSGLRPGETVTLRNNESPPLQAAFIGEVAMPLFCRFRATATRGHRGSVPARLRGARGLPPALPPIGKPTRVRNVTVNQITEFRMPPAMMTLNNLRYTSDDIERPVQGSVEQWNIINVTRDPHPIHLHLVHYRILGRQPFDSVRYVQRHPRPGLGTKWAPSAEGELTGPMVGPAAWEAGRKDVVRADGKQVTRIIVRWPTADELGFDPDARFPAPTDPLAAEHTGMDPSGMDHSAMGHSMDPSAPQASARDLQGYMWHCHILDHEDHDMMLRFRTVAS